MSWKRYFTPVSTHNNSGTFSPLGNSASKPGPARSNYSSFLPEVYTGAPNRIERYLQYNTMDMDSEINAALDILAEFCTNKNKENNTPFVLNFKNRATNSEISILREYLQQWCKLQQFDTRIFRIIRNTFKNGDCIFIRDPETNKWHYIDAAKLVKIIVNESEGKLPEQYVIRDLSPNFHNLVTTSINASTTNTNNRGTSYVAGGAAARGMVGAYPANPSTSGSRFHMGQDELSVDAKHVVHLSLSEGLDNNYPFGNSILETIFKVYKQKELLEDAILIYRIQRAPERRIFYIDVGNMPSHLAMSYVERVKNEIHQRRIPSATGGSSGANVIDSAFNPLSTSEDYYFPQSCIRLDQKIKLLDNRDLMLSEIIHEYEQGIENWTYTVNQNTHDIEPGKIVWAGKTRLDAQLVEVLLDNGEKVIVTPDHRFIMRDGSEVEAQYLKENDSIMACNIDSATFKPSVDNINIVSITWLEDREDTGDITIESASGNHNFALSVGIFIHNSDGKGSKVETLPGGCFSLDTKVSLLDGRELSISEIENEMKNGKELWAYSCEPLTGKVVPGLISWAGTTRKDAEVMKITLDNGEHIICTPDHKFPQYDEEFKRAFEFKVGDSLIPLYRKKEKILPFSSEYEQIFDNSDKKWKFTHRVVENELNKSIPNWNPKDGFTVSGLRRLVKQFGYDSWVDLRKKKSIHNHRIVSIEYLQNTMDVGTLTIDLQEKHHNYHTFALSVGVFVFNSAIGEITDLSYFTNKLFRGLRIPSSYLPTGSEDSQAQFNDGRVGTAYIQELRFNKYCQRLQSLVISVFDQEFKLYLHNRGVNIDSSIFELQFEEPQNFAAKRQAEMDAQRMPMFSQVLNIPIISKRFALSRFLGLSEEEIAENERLWAEENGESTTITTDSSGELRGVGISQAGIESDMIGMADLGGPIPGEGMPPEAGMAPEVGAQAAPAQTTPGQTI